MGFGLAVLASLISLQSLRQVQCQDASASAVFLNPTDSDNTNDPQTVPRRYNVGDTIQASWQSTDTSSPIFSIACCNYDSKYGRWCLAGKNFYEKSLTRTGTDTSSIWRLNVTLGPWEQQHCYTRVNSSASTILAESWLFQIAAMNASGASYWPTNSSTGVQLSEAPVNGSSEAVASAAPAAPISSAIPAPAPNTSTSSPLCSPINIQSNGTPSASCLSGGQYDAECWGELQLSTWIPAWIKQRQPCGLDKTCGNGSRNTWTHAFLSEIDGPNGARDCSALNDGRDCTPTVPNWSCAAADNLSDARHRYVAFAIISIADFFNSWYGVMNQALQNAGAQIDGIIAINIPIKQKSNWWLNALISIATTAICAIPIVGPEASIAVKGLVALGKGVVKGVASNVPSSSSNPAAKQQYYARELKNALQGVTNDSIVPAMNDSLSSSLAFIQGVADGSDANDTYTAFVNFTSSGRLTDSSRSLAQSGLVDSITSVQSRLQTYIVSEALASDGWRVLMLPGVNPVDIAKDSSKNCPQWTGQNCKTDKGNMGCSGALDSYGMCKNWWYSSNLNSAFTLMQGNDSATAGDVTTRLQDIFKSQYTTFVDLFEGATFCQFPSLFQPDANPLWVNHEPTSEWGYIFFGSNASQANDDTIQRQSQIVDASYKSKYEGRDRFLPIAPKNSSRYNAFVELSKFSVYNDIFKHPADAVFQINGHGDVHLNCTSQFNVSVANSWGKTEINNWTKSKGQNNGKALVPAYQP